MSLQEMCTCFLSTIERKYEKKKKKRIRTQKSESFFKKFWVDAHIYFYCKANSEGYTESKKNIKQKYLNNLLSDKIYRTKKVLCFLSRAPTHQSFTFNLWFLYKVKYKVRLSETVCQIIYFSFHFVFITVFSFGQQNAWTIWI